MIEIDGKSGKQVFIVFFWSLKIEDLEGHQFLILGADRWEHRLRSTEGSPLHLMRPLVSEHSTGLGVSLPTCHGYPGGRCLQRWFGVHHHHVQGRVWLGESSSGLDSL